MKEIENSQFITKYTLDWIKFNLSELQKKDELPVLHTHGKSF